MMSFEDRYRRAEARRNDIARLEHLYRFANRWYERYWATQLEALATENTDRVGFAEGHSYAATSDGGWDLDHANEPDNDLGVLVRRRFRTLATYGSRIRVVKDALDAALFRLVFDQTKQWKPHTSRLVCVNVNDRPYWYHSGLGSNQVSRVARVAWSDDDALVLTVPS